MRVTRLPDGIERGSGRPAQSYRAIFISDVHLGTRDCKAEFLLDFPVTGPADVIGDSGAGALDEDLRAACLRALAIPRGAARAHAEKFSWEAAARQFAAHLRPVG